MPPDEWNKEDSLHFELLSPISLMDRDFKNLEGVLDLIEAMGDEFRPKNMLLKRRRRYSRQTLREHLPEAIFQGTLAFTLTCTGFSDSFFNISYFKGNEDVRFHLLLRVDSLSVFGEPGKAEDRTRRVVELARAFAARFPVTYGFAHSGTDSAMGSDPHRGDSLAPKRVYEAHWLNLYGPRMVEELGRQRVLSTPAHSLEELPGGAILLLTRPTPADFASEEARLAQARALVHLRPELNLEETLARLRERSLAFTPIEPDFDPDIADLLTLTLQRSGLDTRRKDIERLNRYHPPPVSEWLPLQQVPTPDVDDVAEAIRLYEHQYAEQLAALLHTKVPSVMDGSAQSLPEIDYFLWWQAWGRRLPPAERELLTLSLGAYLGMVMVRTLGGHWVPRRNPDEALVVVSGRAWQPFLRARRHLQNEQAALDFSLTQFYRAAQRLQ